MNARSPRFALTALLLVSSLAQAAPAATFTLNGKPASLPTVTQNGRVYVDAEAFAKALGASVTFDKAKNSFVVVSSGSKALTEVQGTAQLAGGDGVLGKTYTLGQGEEGLNFTLKSVEYGVARATVGNSVYVPEADEKMLILHYTVQNPQKTEKRFSYGSFKFTAVDAKDINHKFDNYVARAGTSENLNVTLKPAQKIDVVASMTVPAAGPIPKLIVAPSGNGPVLRYDLRGKATALKAPFADPADTSGATALTTVPAQGGTYYPLGLFDLKLDSVAYTKDKIGGKTPAAGKRFLVATFSLKNGTGPTTDEKRWSYGSFKFELKDADGEKVKYGDYLYKATRDETASGGLKSGEEGRFRVFFELPEDVAGATVSVSEGESRTYAFDVSGAK